MFQGLVCFFLVVVEFREICLFLGFLSRVDLSTPTKKEIFHWQMGAWATGMGVGMGRRGDVTVLSLHCRYKSVSTNRYAYKRSMGIFLR